MGTRPDLHFSLPETVVVSGASSGLGYEVCAMLVEAGVRTVGVDREASRAELAEQSSYTHVAGDVAQQDTWEAVAGVVRSTSTASVGLVVAAAILDVGTIVEMDRSSIVRALDVNVVGAALAFKALLPIMIAQGGGPAVAIGSIAASVAEQQLAAYSASKAAVRQLARTIAMDHAREGIRVNVLSPGPMMAGLFKRHLESAVDSDKFLATRAARQPGGQILDPRQVAQSVLFLLSDGSEAFIGADLMADGGLTTSFDFRTGAEGASI